MRAFTPAELAQIAHAVEDYAGNWYGDQPHLETSWSQWDCERYLTDGYLSNLYEPYDGRHSRAQVWEAVREYLNGHPGILVAGRLTDEQRAQQQAARDAAAQALLDQALDAFLRGCWDEALALVDRAEVTSPLYRPRKPYERYRFIIDRRRHEALRTTVPVPCGHGQEADERN